MYLRTEHTLVNACGNKNTGDKTRMPTAAHDVLWCATQRECTSTRRIFSFVNKTLRKAKVNEIRIAPSINHDGFRRQPSKENMVAL